MALQIKVEDNAYQSKIVTLNGNSLTFTFSYNTRAYESGAQGRWYFDIVDRNGNDIISGVKILPQQDLTSKYVRVNSLIGGNIYCVNTKVDGRDVTRDNFGTDKQFQLWYFNTTEETELGL